MGMPRVRITDSRVGTTASWSGTNNGSPFSGTVLTGDTEGLYKRIDDEPHPGFNRTVKSGGVVLGECLIVTSDRTITEGSIHTTSDDGKYQNTTWGDLVTYSVAPCPPEWPSAFGSGLALGELALASAYAKMNSSSILSGEILSDLDKTVGMLHKPFKGARNLVQKMVKYRKRHLGKTIRSATKASSQAWLEYRYGWRPLISDANQIIRDANTFREKMERSRLVARSGREASGSRSTSYVGTPLPALSALGNVDVECRTVLKVGAGVIYDRCDRNSFQRLNEILGTRTMDIPATLWEVIPYSFVVDWFVNVGDWLQAITPNPYVSVRGSWISSSEKSTQSRSGRIILPGGTGGHAAEQTGALGSSVTTTATFHRICNPSITFTPTFTGKLGTLQAIDGLALLANSVMGMLGGLRH